MEYEFLEIMFDALMASLLRPDNAQDFVEKEGIQLTLRYVREKVHSGGNRLRSANVPNEPCMPGRNGWRRWSKMSSILLAAEMICESISDEVD